MRPLFMLAIVAAWAGGDVQLVSLERSGDSYVGRVETFLTDYVKHTDDMVKQVDHVLLDSGRVLEGDEVVIVAGSPPGIVGSTNAMRVHRIGDAESGAVPGYRD